MKREPRSEFPELHRVFSGYLHEDFAAEYGNAAAALRAFREDASPAEWRRFEREALRLARLCKLLHELGSRWTPPSREALIALLTSIKN